MPKFTTDNYMVIDDPTYDRVWKWKLQHGDVIYLDKYAMEQLCTKPIHILKRFKLGDSELQGMVVKCVWSEKKWWQFWKQKKWLGCHVEIR